MEEKDKLIEIVTGFVERVDALNKRCIFALVACVVSMCLLMGFVAFVYFTAEYDYGIVSQYQNGNDNQTQTITNGAEEQ